MILDTNMIQNLLKKPDTSDLTQKAIAQEKRIRLHGKAEVPLENRNHLTNKALTDLILYVKKMLPKDKARTTLNIVRQPLDTVNLMAEVYDQLERAFDGVDREERYDFSSEDLMMDWLQYRDNELGGEDAWRSKGIDTLRSNHNGIMIVDMAAEPNEDGLPAPMWYVKPLEEFHSYMAKADCSMEYVMWKGPKQKDDVSSREYYTLYVIDDESYRVYQAFDIAGSEEVSLIEQINNPHDLEYCPASFFWTDAIDGEEADVKKHPASEFIGRLDWFQFQNWQCRFADLYSGYPIHTIYKSKCNFVDEVSKCDDGYLVSTRQESRGRFLYDDDGVGLRPCPKCKDKHGVGPGTTYEVPIPNTNKGVPAMMPAVGVTTVDVSALKYNSEKLANESKNLFSGMVGSVFDSMSNQAINEKQVMSLFESRKRIVSKIARNFERIQKWTERTVCSLRYGASFSDLTINYGTEFYLFSSSELLDIYSAARDKKLDASILDYLQDTYFATLYRRQPIQLERSRIMVAIDPARHHTIDSVGVLFAAGLLSRDDYGIKLNFSSLINRLESENGAITMFGSALNWDVRISRIKEVLASYLPEEQPPAQNEDGQSSNLPPAQSAAA